MENMQRTWTDAEVFVLRLYVAGQTPRSLRAVVNTQKMCANDLHGIYRLEVIDLYQQPQLAQGEQIVALPALVRRLPPPSRMVIGDMSDTGAVLSALNLRSA
jgi:circadian clock protein KaiB